MADECIAIAEPAWLNPHPLTGIFGRQSSMRHARGSVQIAASVQRSTATLATRSVGYLRAGYVPGLSEEAIQPLALCSSVLPRKGFWTAVLAAPS